MYIIIRAWAPNCYCQKHICTKELRDHCDKESRIIKGFFFFELS